MAGCMVGVITYKFVTLARPLPGTPPLSLYDCRTGQGFPHQSSQQCVTTPQTTAYQAALTIGLAMLAPNATSQNEVRN